MKDLELACRIWREEKLNLVVVKKGETLVSSRDRGIYPLFKTVLDKGGSLTGAAVADRIVGSAAAMLCLYAGVASAYAGTASQKALELLKEQGVDVVSDSVVPYILNHDGTDLCPFEKLAQNISNPSQLFSALESFFAGGNR